MFDKVLIANRGEIAVRIMRACQEMGIATVAVYSDVDRESLHVRLADEAVHVGPAPSLESYLRVDKILEAAKRTGAAGRAPRLRLPGRERGVRGELTRRGPRLHRAQPRGDVPDGRQGERAGAGSEGRACPSVPGTEPIEDVDEALAAAREIGFPAPREGHGGRRRQRHAARRRRSEELRSSFEQARSEALSRASATPPYSSRSSSRSPATSRSRCSGTSTDTSYTSSSASARSRGATRSSSRRRPRPSWTRLRERMGEAAVALAREAGYYNAGTVEFLVDDDKNFYFLEMNARLQVEHPVTELVTGRRPRPRSSSRSPPASGSSSPRTT